MGRVVRRFRGVVWCAAGLMMAVVDERFTPRDVVVEMVMCNAIGLWWLQ